VGINIQSYIEPLSREIVIGNKEHLATILETLKSSNLLKDVSLSKLDSPLNTPQKEQCSLNGLKIEFMTPVTFGQRQVATLKGNILWIPIAQIIAIIGIAVLLSLFFMWISTRMLLEDLHKAIINPICKLARGEILNGGILTSDVLKIKRDLEVSRENAQYAALAQLTQMLAHDVRKPFSMIQIVLQNIASTQTLSEVKNIIRSSSQEITRALTTVNGMLSDIMEIGQDTVRSRELVSPKSLIYISIQEVSRLLPDSNITFSASFDHKYLLEIDPIKVQRVLSNIIENAVQAMKGEGHLWFQSTAPDSNGFVEMIIGNTGSYVESDDIQKLFDAFFTKGKKGGTGLGLAIAKKIVTAHGGQIGCRVLNKKGVEFWFTLPVSEKIDAVNIILPKSTIEVLESMYSVTMANVDEFSEDDQSQTYEAEIVQKLNGRRIKVLILDDEELYRNALIRLLQKLNRVSSYIDLLVATSSNEALAHAMSKPDIGLFDYDLGESSKNGIDTLKLMRQSVPGICICIHSNHIGGTQYKEAVDAGARYFLPKPISKVHLLRIISESLDVTQVHMIQSSYPQSLYSEALRIPALPFPVAQSVDDGVVAILDDCDFNCSAWNQLNIGRPLITFESPEMFWQHMEKHPDFFNSLALIVTDQFFGSKSAITGIDFARTITGKPVFLASVGDFSNEVPIHGITGVLPKKVMEWNELLAFCANRSKIVPGPDTPNSLGQLSHSGDPILVKEIRPSVQTNKVSDLQINLKVKFLASAFDIFNEIEIAMQQKNLRQVFDLVHKLQGAANIVDAHSVVNACRKIHSRQISEGDCIALLRDSIFTMEQELKSQGYI
jgi:signal transduction histidine kinase/CheY-like chemotaxis protein/HPt (histidine-containing phosphotransfer) domain-containing protein